MKFLKIGDLHFGVKKDDPWIQRLQSHAIDYYIDYSVKNNIKTWIQGGDWFDVRSAITHTCMEFNKEQCLKIKEAGIQVLVIVGNHDSTYKTTLQPNACNELLPQFNNITVYDKPTTVDLDGFLIDLIPWMCEENTKEILDHIKTSSAEYCIGHWELNGFWFYKGLKSHGIDAGFLKRYKQVWSGHFHTISEAGNVQYIGTPYTLTAGDENDQRGAWLFDTKTEVQRFVPNPITWHRKIFYPTDKTIDINSLKNLSVRIIVEEMDKDFTKFESKVEDVVHELRVVSKIDNSLEVEETEEEIKSVLDLMEDYIDALEEDQESKETLKTYIKQMYIEVTNK